MAIQPIIPLTVHTIRITQKEKLAITQLKNS